MSTSATLERELTEWCGESLDPRLRGEAHLTTCLCAGVETASAVIFDTRFPRSLLFSVGVIVSALNVCSNL